MLWLIALLNHTACAAWHFQQEAPAHIRCVYRLREMFCSCLLNYGLELCVPAIVGNKPPHVDMSPAVAATTLQGIICWLPAYA